MKHAIENGRVEQKVLQWLHTHSLQQHEKIRLKHLFRATDTLSRPVMQRPNFTTTLTTQRRENDSG